MAASKGTNRQNVIGTAQAAADVLSLGAVDLVPTYVPATRHERFLEAAQCDECQEYVVRAEDHKDDCERFGEDAADLGAEGPMMDVLWPVPDPGRFETKNARLLGALNVCLVLDADGECGLALTGAGMDFAWEIAAAYVRLGYCPPGCIELPTLAGLRLDAETATVIAAMMRTFDTVAGRAQRSFDRTRDLLDEEVTPLPEERAKSTEEADPQAADPDFPGGRI